MNIEQVRKVLAVLRYHNHRKVIDDPDYVDSSLEGDTLQAISNMQELLNTDLRTAVLSTNQNEPHKEETS